MKAALLRTEPKLVKGPKPLNIPKGSTLEREWSKNDWYINYSFNGKQVRVKANLNRIKDHKDKAYQAEVLLLSIKNDLANGYNPSAPDAFIEQLSKENISIAEAVGNYVADVRKHTRRKTVESYQCKLRYLVEAFPNKKLKDLTVNAG